MGLIFVGYVLVFFHLRINGFDLLPNFIGYALIYSGLRGLALEADSFRMAKPWTLGLGIFALISQIVVLFNSLMLNMMLGMWNILFMAAALYALYLIDRGVRELEGATGADLGSKNLFTIWKIQAWLQVLNVGLNVIPARLAQLLSMTCGLFCIGANVAFLAYWNWTRKAYRAIEE